MMKSPWDFFSDGGYDAWRCLTPNSCASPSGSPGAAGAASPNPMVGAALVKGGTITGRGWHRRGMQNNAASIIGVKPGKVLSKKMISKCPRRVLFRLLNTLSVNIKAYRLIKKHERLFIYCR
jgi:hypothetical protein